MNFDQAALTNYLSNQADIELAFLFGSRAKNTARQDSDIDLAIRCKTPLSTERKITLTEQLAKQFGLAVDLIDIHNAGEPLLGQIIQGTMLIGQNNQKADLIYRHLINQADFLPLRDRILKERRELWINK